MNIYLATDNLETLAFWTEEERNKVTEELGGDWVYDIAEIAKPHLAVFVLGGVAENDRKNDFTVQIIDFDNEEEEFDEEGNN